ncbi:MAG: hypothetical protein GY719_25970 [bacterium]|nr:hypothetical protein [bacterium]
MSITRLARAAARALAALGAALAEAGRGAEAREVYGWAAGLERMAEAG